MEFTFIKHYLIFPKFLNASTYVCLSLLNIPFQTFIKIKEEKYCIQSLL